VGGQRHDPAALLHDKENCYPLYMRQGEPQGRSGLVRKIPPPPGFEPRTAQPVASHYMSVGVSLKTYACAKTWKNRSH